VGHEISSQQVKWCAWFNAGHCLECHNYNSTFAIVGGLGHGSVSRLRQTWDRLPSKWIKHFQVSEICFNNSNNNNNNNTCSPLRWRTWDLSVLQHWISSAIWAKKSATFPATTERLSFYSSASLWRSNVLTQCFCMTHSALIAWTNSHSSYVFNFCF